MYYVVNAAGHTEGPYPADWVRANAGPATLVSHQQQWVAYQSHPDFQPSSIVRSQTPCPGCAVARGQGLRFCTTCGNSVAAAPNATARPSVHLSLLNILLPGVAQIVFGQTAKGILMIVASFVTIATVVVHPLIVILSVVDGYKVGGKLHRDGVVGPWEILPG